MKIEQKFVKIAFTTAFLITTVLFSNSALATSTANFEAGNIIDDIVFTNSQSMTVEQIQAFLDSKVPICDTWHTGFYGASGTWYGPPFTCLKDYTENSKTSAQIIYDEAQTYQINPQVLIVLLQKEQALITDTWPASFQYKTATGYGCPDTSACDTQYYGFTNQVHNAAKMFRAILNNSPTWYTPYELGNNYIQYNPDSGCGGTIVNIQNRATQALYNYTPYQPNTAALNAGYGTGDGCSAYGNRNFFLYFSSWFGTTKAFLSMETPRWMVAKNDTHKLDLSTGLESDVIIAKGTQIRFTSKVFTNNRLYLRTESDTNTGVYTVIPFEDLEDISYMPLDTPIYMESANDNINKIIPNTGVVGPATKLLNGQSVKLVDKIIINGITYYRTAFDNINNINTAFPLSSLKAITVLPLETPRYFQLKNDTHKVTVDTLIESDEIVSKDTVIFFTNKVLVDGMVYYLTRGDAASEVLLAVPSTEVSQPVASTIEGGSRWVYINNDTKKYSILTTQPVGGTLTKDRQIKIVDSYTIDGTTYYRTEYDKNNNNLLGIPSTYISEISFIQMDSPRYLILSRSTPKENPLNSAQMTIPIQKDTKIYFTTKIVVNGIIYLRSEFDTTNNNTLGIRLNDLTNL